MVNYNVTVHKADWGGVLVQNSTWAVDGQVFSVPSGQSFSAKWSLTDGVMSSENTSYISYEKYGEMVGTTSITVRSDLDIWPSIAPEGVTFVYSVSTSTPGVTLRISIGGVSSNTSVTSSPHKYLSLGVETTPAGYVFDHWSRSINGGAEEVVSRSVNYSTSYPPGWDTEYIAYFTVQTCTLTFKVNNSGHGTVRTNGASSTQVTLNDVPVGASMSLNPSTGVVTVASVGSCTPEPDSGYMFGSWSPSIPSQASTATYTVSFVQEVVTHSVSITAGSNGTVTLEPSGGTFSCPDGATVTVENKVLKFTSSGTVVKKATPNANQGYTFVNWTRSVGALGDPITANTSFTANFVQSTGTFRVSITRVLYGRVFYSDSTHTDVEIQFPSLSLY